MRELLQTVVFLVACLTSSTALSFELMGDKTNLFENRTYHSMTGLASMEYFLLRPVKVETGKLYPLVVTLPGASQHSYGAYMLGTPEMQERYPAFVLVPHEKVTSWTLPLYTDLRAEPSAHIVSIIKSLEKKFPIDRSRVYLTGYSIGGYGTFAMIAKYHDVFAAAAPLCGGGDARDAANMIYTPIWAFHGSKDAGISPEESRRLTAAIQHAGGNVRYTEYPDLGHNIWERVYAQDDFWKWLFSQRLSN